MNELEIKLISTLESLVNIHSPSGYTNMIISYIENSLPIPTDGFVNLTNKGSLSISLTHNPKLVLAAHVDTLGAMVKEINSDGTLGITMLGGYPLNSFEGEYVTIRNFNGELFRGTFLLNNPAAHVNKEVGSAKRDLSNMSIRLDMLVKNEKEVRDLGIEVGDFVFYDTRFECTESGFIKCRFLDDKACAAVLYELAKELIENNSKSEVAFYFSNYEEVGHGACVGIPESVNTLLVLDMAVIGDGCRGKEDKVSICVKDSSGPYDFNVTSQLRKIADVNNINYVTDIYPFYGSDGSAALAAGYDLKVGLIGPGVSASHGVERTHINGMIETYKLSKLFIENFAD
jgi:putative aminopeptidase FrvX